LNHMSRPKIKRGNHRYWPEKTPGIDQRVWAQGISRIPLS
jgi:hypothetical protein